MVIKYLLKLFLVLIFFVSINQSKADFFKDITSLIENNDFRLSYGVSVTDINQDDKYEFVVTGFGFSNLALSYQNGKLININKNEIFDDVKRKILEYLEKDEIGQSKCKLCGKVSSGRNHVQDMKKHIETHFDGLSFSCKICGKEFRSSRALKTHTSTYHRSK